MSYYSDRITGAQLRARREALKLTQLQLAEKLGVTTRSVMRWEKDGGRAINARGWMSGKVERVLGDLESASRDKQDDPERHVTSRSRNVSRDNQRPRRGVTSRVPS